MKTFKNTAKISVTNARETENGTVSFAEPLAITDDSRQWNNTRYDINTLDITPYDGTVTADHGQKISDVIGKIINLRKEGNKVLIDGIKFAVNENPLAVLAKNLMKGGFVTGVSIETIGEDPDDTLTWKNHALCGLSVVAHPNNKNAYAVVSNSLEEAKQHGFSAEQMTELNAEANRVLNLQDKTDGVSNKLDKITKNTTKNLYFSDKTRYNDTMSNLHERTDAILNKFETNDTTKSGGNGGNPWHDDFGRFTFSPFGSLVYKGYGHGSLDSRGNPVPSRRGGAPGGSYRREYDKATLSVDFGYMQDPTDGEYKSIEDMDPDAFKQALDEAVERFTHHVERERLKRAEKKREEEQERERGKETMARMTEKYQSLSESQIAKTAAKYEKQLRNANPKAEAKLKKGLEIKQLATIATRTGGFNDDGNYFSEWQLNGLNPVVFGDTGRITKHTSNGEAYINGRTAGYDSAAYKLKYHSDSKSVNAAQSIEVGDFNGVPTSHVNYTQLYNEMVKGCARNLAIEELLK